MTDTHAHLASSRFENELDAVIGRAQDEGVARIVAIACDLEDSAANIVLSDRYAAVAPTVGVHPLYVHEPGATEWFEELSTLARTPGVAAIGEIGLDYHHPPGDASTEKEWRSKQRKVFEKQLQLAVDLDLPAVIHQRQSAEDVAGVLRQFPKVRAVLHCFTGTVAEAEAALEMGHFLSYTGILTFPSAEDVRETARIAPLDRVMVETDSPYLAPIPYRGKRCEPLMVTRTAEKLAEIHEMETDEIASVTSRNAETFFKNLLASAPV
ncbi:MAG: TatD family hydrolase [Verrucomicrobiales bacterium]